MKIVWRTASGLLLAALGVAMCVVALTGDSLFYVRDIMTVPLVLAGGFVTLLGIGALTGRVATDHTPRSFALALVAVAFIIVVRPGPLSVEAGSVYDASAGGRVQQHFDIPRDAIVGVDASDGAIDDHAVELTGGQMWFAVQHIPDVFEEVAIRMIGQYDERDVDGDGTDDPVVVRLFITCCAADALQLTTPLSELDATFEPGDWIEVVGQWDGEVDRPGMRVTGATAIERPDRPYLTARDG